MQDFWKSPLQSSRWAHLVIHTTHLKEPEFTTITTDGQVQRTLRGFTIVRLGKHRGHRQELDQMEWKRLIQLPKEAHTLQVEIQQSEHLATRRAVYHAAAQYEFTWDGPFHSVASQGHRRRIRFQIYAPKTKHSRLGAYILCSLLKKAEGLTQANIGMEELGNDLTAKIAEIHNPTALKDVEDLTQEVLMISPQEALISTTAAQQTWEQRLTELKMRDRQTTSPIAAIKWRQARGGGIWARPRTLAEVSPRGPDKPHPGRVFITIQGPIGREAHGQIRQIMDKVRELTKTTIREQRQGSTLRKGHWRIDEDPTGGTTGHVEVLTENKEQAEHFQRALANVAVAVQLETVPLQVTGDALVTGTFRRP